MLPPEVAVPEQVGTAYAGEAATKLRIDATRRNRGMAVSDFIATSYSCSVFMALMKRARLIWIKPAHCYTSRQIVFPAIYASQCWARPALRHRDRTIGQFDWVFLMTGTEEKRRARTLDRPRRTIRRCCRQLFPTVCG